MKRRTIQKFFDRLESFFEYLLAILFLIASYSEVVYTGPAIEGVVGLLFSSPVTSIIYAVWFATIALVLLYSKWFKKKKLQKHTLMAMYLTTIYTMIISILAVGVGQVVDDFIIGLIAAVCWVRWKMRTEYINPKDFSDIVWELRRDTPSKKP